MPATETELTALVRQHMQDIPQNPDEKIVQGHIFDLRRHLIHKLTTQLMQENTTQDHTATNHDNTDNLTRQDALEDILRKSLPILIVPPMTYAVTFSAWRTSILAVLGLLLGSAVGQALVLLNIGLGASWVVLCGVLGIVSFLWLAEYCVQAAAKGSLLLPAFIAKTPLAWKKVRRYALWAWTALLIVTIVRDFFGGREVLAQGIHTLSLFLSTGNVLGMFSNIYILLIFFACFALLLKRPLHFDQMSFRAALVCAVQNWWGASLCAAKTLMENITLKEHNKQRPLQEVGADLYSLAAELPTARRLWLEERLQRLGLNSVQQHKEQGLLAWQTSMLEYYTPLGHIEIGDACYVDEAPLMADGALVRKGTVRKVRR